MATALTARPRNIALNLAGAARLFVMLAAATACTPEVAVEAPPPRAFVGGDACAACHSSEHQRWSNSHHDLAMQVANENSVLGDFDDAVFSYAGIETRFYREGDTFFVETDGPSGRVEPFEIAYTFGVEPLQQYLVAFPDGRLQALSIAWDARSAGQGGQRWFHLYADDAIDFQDPLHWTGPLQNWNFMCAECHSTNLAKNYLPEDERFDTRWSDVDVSCEACHGPGAAHVAWANDGADGGDPQIYAFLDAAVWTMNLDTGIAEPQPDRPSAAEIEVCARCHSRRSTLSEDYVHGEPLLDTHRPALLEEDLYYADGQIKDEVFVYGSFLQSKMHAAGVVCTDCHDAHSLELKATGNAVCAQCHLPTTFDIPAHHNHVPGSTGAQCVSCHMASRTYMTVDPRRDHSFRIPQPDVSTRIPVPNACTQCHDDQTDAWAAAAIADWFGDRTTEHFGETIHAARQGAPGAATKLEALALDGDTPAIVRATAVTLLADRTGQERATASATTERDGLLRLAAAETLDTNTQLNALASLLDDPLKAVRLAAAARVATVSRGRLRQPQSDALTAALEEYRETQRLNADRAEANVNVGVLEAASGNLGGAVAAYRNALDRNPHFVPAYINLADLYRQAGRESDAAAVLQRGLETIPENSALLHALGLSLTRSGDYERAIEALRTAHEFTPGDARYAYVYAIALNSLGEASAALEVLRTTLGRQPSDRAVLTALTTISRDEGLMEDAREYARRLLQITPDDATAQRLVDSLDAQ